MVTIVRKEVFGLTVKVKWEKEYRRSTTTTKQSDLALDYIFIRMYELVRWNTDEFKHDIEHLNTINQAMWCW